MVGSGEDMIELADLTPNDIERFWHFVQKTDGCWLWTGSVVRKRGGYGQFNIRGRIVKPHRPLQEDPMTISDAYARIAARWPGSFCIGVNVWHYDHLPSDPPHVEYRIWNGTARESYEGPTLEAAMTLALGTQEDLAAVDRQVISLEMWAGRRA